MLLLIILPFKKVNKMKRLLVLDLKNKRMNRKVMFNIKNKKKQKKIVRKKFKNPKIAQQELKKLILYQQT